MRLWAWDEASAQLGAQPLSALAVTAALPLLHGNSVAADSGSAAARRRAKKGGGGGGTCGARLRSMDYHPTNGLLLGSHASELLLVRDAADKCSLLVHGHAQRPLVGAAAAEVKAEKVASRMA